MSINFPCIGGITPPPKIIIIKNAEPCGVCFPSPLSDKLKIIDHIMLQNNPHESMAYTAVIPVVLSAMAMAITPKQANTKSEIPCEFLQIIKAAI